MVEDADCVGVSIGVIAICIGDPGGLASAGSSSLLTTEDICESWDDVEEDDSDSEISSSLASCDG